MKKMCLALIMFFALIGTTAWGKTLSPLTNLTLQNITKQLSDAAAPYNDWSVANPQSVDNGKSQDFVYKLSSSTSAIASINKKSSKVTQLLFIVAQDTNVTSAVRAEALVKEMLQSVETATRIVFKDFENVNGLKEALYNTVGPLNKKLYNEVGKKHSLRLNGIDVIMTAMFTDKGLYVLSVTAE